jgi:hypothetical protein
MCNMFLKKWSPTSEKNLSHSLTSKWSCSPSNGCPEYLRWCQLLLNRW